MLADILLTAVNAVFPMVLLILLGYFLKQRGFFSEDFLNIGNALVFNVCMPCMLFVNIYEISGIGAIAWDLVLYCCIAIVVLFVLGLAAAVVTTGVPNRRGVIWQSCFRSNYAIIGLPLAAVLGGAEATAIAAVVSAMAIPLFNIFGVIALSVFADGKDRRISLRQILLDIVKNPLILGVAAGLICLVLRAIQQQVFGEVVFALDTQLSFLYTVAENLNVITSPFAMLILGAQFTFRAVRGLTREILVGTLMRIVVAPILCIGGAVILNELGWIACGSRELPAMLALFGTPVAVSSAIMAQQMKSDGQLATQLVVWTSVGSIVTIFAAVCILMFAGLLPAA